MGSPLPLARPVVFPLLGIVDGKCACGNEKCTRVGKHPAISWGDLKLGDEVPKPAPGAGAGLKTGASPLGSGVFVVDLDSQEASEAFDDMGDVPDTYTVCTPRGWHLYFRHPGFHVGNSAGELGKGIDIRGDGGFVVAPGSPHASGSRYVVDEEASEEIADAPDWLLDWLRARPAKAEIQTYPGDVTGETRTRNRETYAEYLKKKAPPCIQGHGGDGTLFQVVQHGAYDLSLSTEDVLELVREHYDHRCVPPWGEALEDRVLHKAHSAKTASTKPRAEPWPQDLTFNEGLDLGDLALADPEQEAIEDPDDAALNLVWGKWDEPLSPPDYLVDPILPAESVGIFVAKGSSLKTWTALSIAAAVASGQSWLGAFPVKKAPVVIVDFESGRWQLRSRMEILGRQKCPDLGHSPFPDGRVDDPELWRKIARVVKRRGVKLVIVDSFAAGASGVDENDAKAAAPLHLASEFSEKMKCAVLFIHHAKKGEGGDERDVARGSGAIYAGCDWMYVFSPLDEHRQKMLVHCNKPWGPRPDDFRIELRPDGLFLDTSASEEQASEQESLALIRSKLVQPRATLADISHACGKKSGWANDRIKAMVKRREVTDIPGQGYTLDYPKARLDRIRAAVLIPGRMTPEGLAKAAHVDLDEVHSAIAENVIVRSGSGFIVCS